MQIPSIKTVYCMNENALLFFYSTTNSTTNKFNQISKLFNAYQYTNNHV